MNPLCFRLGTTQSHHSFWFRQPKNYSRIYGKKSLAYQIIYRAVKQIQQKIETNPLSVLRQAIRGVTSDVAVKARRVGRSTHQVPIEIGSS